MPFNGAVTQPNQTKPTTTTTTESTSTSTVLNEYFQAANLLLLIALLAANAQTDLRSRFAVKLNQAAIFDR